MSTNVQVRVITGEFEKKAMKTIASGKMRIGIEKEEEEGKENVTSIVVYDGVLKDGIIKKANEEVKEK
jgi:hypothetical protein